MIMTSVISLPIIYLFAVILFAAGVTALPEVACSEIISVYQLCRKAKAGIAQITVADLKKKIEDNEKFALIDVRTEAEYRAGYISGAVWIPRGMLELKIEKHIPDANLEINFYCGKGSGGDLAAKTLMDMGYKRVFNLEGGVKGWSAAGYPLYNMLGEIRHFRYGVSDPGGSSE